MSNNNITFETWMAKVDRILSTNLGIGYLDLPDVDYMSMYEDGAPPKEAAITALEEVTSSPLEFLG